MRGSPFGERADRFREAGVERASDDDGGLPGTAHRAGRDERRVPVVFVQFAGGQLGFDGTCDGKRATWAGVGSGAAEPVVAGAVSHPERGGVHVMHQPPSMVRHWPVMNPASGKARKLTAAAMS